MSGVIRSSRRAPGRLGAHWDGEGTSFAVFSSLATAIDLDLDGAAVIPLTRGRHGLWSTYAAGVGPGARYGFRAEGPWEPATGRWFNSSKLLVDPYARQIDGAVVRGLSALPYLIEDHDTASDEESGGDVPWSVVVDPAFSWEDDRRPGVPMADSVIYEVHVKGFTMTHPDIPAELRGTYAGLAHPAAIAHFQSLGITTLELMPVHAFLHDMHLVERSLVNYWGYNTLGFFAPHGEYASPAGRSDPTREFKAMVATLHRAGLEVILDVVYNHTCEGNHLGPLLSFQGLDNPAYYRLVEGDARYYHDVTGTGNTLNTRHPQTVRLILDSLRYWVEEMHIDGFRFDLAAALGRGWSDFDGSGAFFAAVHQDPVLQGVKLIAEPWDVGDHGYRLGQFPWTWAEWNDRYRDTVRDFWRSVDGTLPEFARRLTGSEDLFAPSGRGPDASINIVTTHDGFTLADLVAYNHKHNDANLEDSRDGTDNNRSWNLGAEGATDDADIQARRRRQQRNVLTTLLLSHGVPLLAHGDELGRTQSGNNNAYCHDSALSWVNWEDADRGLMDLVSRLLTLRREQPVLRLSNWLRDGDTRDQRASRWFRADGRPMRPADWDQPERKAVTFVLNGRHSVFRQEPQYKGRGAVLSLVFNAHLEDLPLVLPHWPSIDGWEVVVDTAGVAEPPAEVIPAGQSRLMPSLSMLVCRGMPRRRGRPFERDTPRVD